MLTQQRIVIHSFSFGAVSLNFVAVLQCITDCLELQSIFFSHVNYVERIMLCRQENIVQIARFVILGADRRSRLRCERWQTLAFDLVSTHYVYFSNKTNWA